MNRKRILNVAGVVVLLALVIPFVIYAVPGVIGASESYVILSGSMEPEMSPGDAVIVDDRGAGSIDEGDVITFSRSGSDTVVTHRVVDVREENGQRVFETKGDANDQADREPVPAENVVGTVALTIPLIGYVVHFVNTPLGFATTVLLPIGLFVASEVWTFVRGSLENGEETGAVDGNGDQARNPAVGGHGAEERRAEATDGGSIDENGGRRPPAGDPETTSGEPSEPDQGGVAVDATDLAATTVLLVLLTPYAAYVALQLQTLATIAIAYTVGFSAFALGALQVAAVVQQRGGGDQPEDSGAAGSGAVADGVERNDTERGAPDAERPLARTDPNGSPETNGGDPAPVRDDAAVGVADDPPADGEEEASTAEVPDLERADERGVASTEDGESR